MGYIACFIAGGWFGIIIMCLMFASKKGDDPK